MSSLHSQLTAAATMAAASVTSMVVAIGGHADRQHRLRHLRRKDD